MTNDPQRVAADIPEDVRRAAAALAYAPHAYFLTADATLTIPIGRLRLSRARPDGIASAVRRMAEAAKGARPRRVPIRVRGREDGDYDVLDGNSTVVIAAAAHWPDLPACFTTDATRLKVTS